MKKRIYINMLLMAFFCCIFLITFLIVTFYSFFGNHVTAELRSKAVIIESILESIDNDVSFLNALHFPSADARINIITPDGKVLFDNAADIGTLPNHLNRKEVQLALKNGADESRRFSDTLGTQTYYYAKKTNDGYVLRLSKTTSSLYAVFYKTWPVIALVIILILVFANFLALRLTKKIIAPINKIDFGHINDEKIDDELAPFVRTITNQKLQIQEQMALLHEKADTLNAIAQSMEEGLILLDDKGIVLSANNSAVHILGTAIGNDPMGKNIIEITRNAEILENTTLVLKGESHNITLELSAKIYHIFFNSIPGGGAMILFLDITEKSESEKMRREFSANVSHELKTPLTSIFGFAEMIANGMVKSTDIITFSEKIKSESQRLLHLIDDIIKLSQLDESTGIAEFTAVDLASVIDNVHDGLCPIAKKHDVTLHVNAPKTIVTANTDMMYEMVFNLVDNAIKYNKPGGSVDISLSQQDGHTTLTVRDTGLGVPKESIDRIFERFYRVDKSHSKKTGGTGLGLSIVKHIVLRHNGTIAIESEFEKYTAISVVLP